MGRRIIDRRQNNRVYLNALALVFLFAAFTIVVFIRNQDHSFSSLSTAVNTVSNGGTVDVSIPYKGGVFVFIKNSSIKDFGYFYVKDEKWYTRSGIVSSSYNIEDKYTVTTYYIIKPKYYFIRVESDKEEITNVSDSIDTNFKLINILQGNDYVDIHFGGNSNALTKGYIITINDEDYLLMNYYKSQKLLQLLP